ncbi:MAG: helix-turn-helix transcriptional regulator [Anaerolineae bacterium]|nr:helix-turn-helix transcriptional regulator [Anaerolineae bacterium]
MPERLIQDPSALSRPRLIRSSKGLGWQDIEILSYLEPAQTERWTETVSPDITIVLLTQGVANLTQCDCATCKGFQLKQHDLILKPAITPLPDIRWKTQSHGSVETLRLHLSHRIFSQAIEELVDRDPSKVRFKALIGFQDRLLLQVGLALARELETPSPISSLYAQTAAHMLVVHLLRTYVTNPASLPERRDGLSQRQMKQIRNYVWEHLTHPLSLEELAQQVGFSPYHFARLFREATGESPHQFVIRQRVEYAENLLRTSKLALAEVAIASGFADQSHLTQVFKRHTGLTPKAFRRII